MERHEWCLSTREWKLLALVLALVSCVTIGRMAASCTHISLLINETFYKHRQYRDSTQQARGIQYSTLLTASRK